MEWDKESVIKLIDVYKEYEILWNSSHRDHYNRQCKQQVWREIGKKMERSVDECRKKIEILMSGMRREKMKMIRSIRMAKGPEGVYKSSWFAFNRMQFLWERHIPRKSKPIVLDSQEDDPSKNPSDNPSNSPTNNPPNETNDSSDISHNFAHRVNHENAAVTKRPHTILVSHKRKLGKIKTDLRFRRGLDVKYAAAVTPAATTVAATTSTPTVATASTNTTDDSYHFGQFVTCKMREYDSKTRLIVQSEIMSIFARANVGHYSTYSSPSINIETTKTEHTHDHFGQPQHWNGRHGHPSSPHSDDECLTNASGLQSDILFGPDAGDCSSHDPYVVATSSEPETPAAIEASDEPNNTQKKRKLITGSAQDSSACEHRWTRAQPRTNKFSESPTKERHHQDEFDTFGQHVSNQLRSLPLTNAIVCQNYINNYLSEERLKVINAGYQNTRQSKTVDDDQSASNIYLATASNSSIDPMEDYMVDFTSDPNTSDFIKVEDNELE